MARADGGVARAIRAGQAARPRAMPGAKRVRPQSARGGAAPAPQLSREERVAGGRSMIFYRDIDAGTPEGRRTASGLLSLKSGIAKSLPPKLVDGNFLLATWNIREFGGHKGGGRRPEALYYIAEVISAFDCVAIQEVRDDVRPFRRVKQLLGPWWRYLVTDITVGRRGNHERLAFLYDSRKIKFAGLASQVVLPPDERGGKRRPVAQISRTPFIVGLQAGWFKFTLCAAHILYGSAKPDDVERISEIRSLARFLRGRVEDPHAWSRNMVVLGDFNIFEPGDETMKALQGEGFEIPAEILRQRRRRHYDQIAFHAPYLQERRTRVGAKNPSRSKLDRSHAGVFPMYDFVYRDDDEEDLTAYAAEMGRKLPPASDAAARRKFVTAFRQWRTYQLSDHVPLWIELDTDWSRGLLAQRRAGKPSPEHDAATNEGAGG